MAVSCPAAASLNFQKVNHKLTQPTRHKLGWTWLVPLHTPHLEALAASTTNDNLFWV
jgi:hypothetical protein